MPSAASSPSLYFGYGSNLWRHQMQQRCPTSSYVGLGLLDGYRWIINSRGFANVVELAQSDRDATLHERNHVWGLVYALQPSDEARLDCNERVPHAYTKEILSCSFWEARHDAEPFDVLAKSEKRDMLVYIDRKRTAPDTPVEEYVYRMNRAVQDAVKEGVPEAYVDAVVRPFIPAEHEASVGSVAGGRALEF